MPDLTTQVDFIEDDVLRLIFLSCHPQLTPESRAALTLRLVGGLSTAEIARGFLAAETAMGQRISRAKKTLSEARAEFELPVGDERTDRLDDVMAVVYLIFNEGYTATAGDDWMRPELTNEAIRLARMLAELMPDEPEVHGLQALLELQASRGAARVDAEGRPVLLDDQDRSLWDELLIRRGLAALERAEQLAARGKAVGRYYLQAAIASRHARAADARGDRLARHRDGCTTCSPRPHPARSWRSTAPSRTGGRSARTPASPMLDDLPEGALAGSHLLPSVRADLLARAGRHAEAAASFREAASLTANESEQVAAAGPRRGVGQGGRLGALSVATPASAGPSSSRAIRAWPTTSRSMGSVRGMADDWRADVVEQVRALVVRAEPDVVEEAKWRKASNPDGVPTFSHSGLICTVETYKDKVKVTFAKGASLDDPSSVFNASLDAGTRRAVDLHSAEDLDEDAFVALVRAAVALNAG